MTCQKRRIEIANSIKHQLLVDILKNGAWVDTCPQEMVARARAIYPEKDGFSFIPRTTRSQFMATIRYFLNSQLIAQAQAAAYLDDQAALTGIDEQVMREIFFTAQQTGFEGEAARDFLTDFGIELIFDGNDR